MFELIKTLLLTQTYLYYHFQFSDSENSEECN